MANMFDKAAANAATETKKTSRSKPKPQIQVNDLHIYAALKSALKTIETMVDTLKADINDEALDAFIAAGRADSIQGVDGDTTASLQLRKRTSRSILNEQEKKLLDELGVSTEKSTDARFYINNKYAEDGDLLAKVSKALDGIVPDDFLGGTSPKFVTTNDSIREAFDIADDNVRHDVLKIVSTQAARTRFGGSHDDMLAILDGVLKEE